jgi:prepilin-type processing-associated H-X9-DG protein
MEFYPSIEEQSRCDRFPRANVLWHRAPSQSRSRCLSIRLARPVGGSLRTAYTLIEALVTVGLVAILAGLSLPAVQQARESSRRAQCQSNLRQIGLAIQGYSAANNCFPPASMNSRKYKGFHSLFTRTLPYLDQSQLYNAVNFSTGTIPLDSPWISNTGPVYQKVPELVNETVYTSSLALLLCPSDSGSFGRSGCNYRGNTGVGPWFITIAETPDSGNGLFPELEVVRESSVPDGLSQTACVSERLRGAESASAHASRLYFGSPQSGVFTANDSFLTCQIYGRPNNPKVYTQSGSWWFWGGKERTLYNHTQSPNGPVPDCIHGQVITSAAMSTARSLHPGSVNALFGDGSVRGITSAINQAVWQSLGTRNGGEVVDVGAQGVP